MRTRSARKSRSAWPADPRRAKGLAGPHLALRRAAATGASRRWASASARGGDSCGELGVSAGDWAHARREPTRPGLAAGGTGLLADRASQLHGGRRGGFRRGLAAARSQRDSQEKGEGKKDVHFTARSLGKPLPRATELFEGKRMMPWLLTLERTVFDNRPMLLWRGARKY